jgi:hypothetical protein
VCVSVRDLSFSAAFLSLFLGYYISATLISMQICTCISILSLQMAVDIVASKWSVLVLYPTFSAVTPTVGRLSSLCCVRTALQVHYSLLGMLNPSCTVLRVLGL